MTATFNSLFLCYITGRCICCFRPRCGAGSVVAGGVSRLFSRTFGRPDVGSKLLRRRGFGGVASLFNCLGCKRTFVLGP